MPPPEPAPTRIVANRVLKEESYQSYKKILLKSKSEKLSAEHKAKLAEFKGEIDRFGPIAFLEKQKSLKQIVKGVADYCHTQGRAGIRIIIILQMYDLFKTAADQAALNNIESLLKTLDLFNAEDISDVWTSIKEARKALKETDIVKEHNDAWQAILENAAVIRLIVEKKIT